MLFWFRPYLPFFILTFFLLLRIYIEIKKNPIKRGRVVKRYNNFLIAFEDFCFTGFVLILIFCPSRGIDSITPPLHSMSICSDIFDSLPLYFAIALIV